MSLDVPESLARVMRELPTTSDRRHILTLREEASRRAQIEPFPPDIDSRLQLALASQGITALYRHQRRAWDVVATGEDLLLVTPTASGKTLAFALPVLDRSLKYPPARSLFFYPTKALANDQAANLQRLLEGVEGAPSVAVYHGDLSTNERRCIQDNPPSILLVTPDIIHHQQLPHHAEWMRLWANLHFIVVDEAHAYRGVFGTHMAHLMRRVIRIARLHGASPQFLAASATIGNPVEHLSALTGRAPHAITETGAPQPGRHLVVWEALAVTRDQIRTPIGSSEGEAAELIAAGVLAGLAVIGFARSRRSVERISRRVQKTVVRAGGTMYEGCVVPYRAGYLRQRREQIEQQLREGKIRAVVATNALELGVDIGSLDMAVLSSYPGSTMAFRQQAGRAGRRDRQAVVVMVASQNPLDRYLATNPDQLLQAAPEKAAIDLGNASVAAGHLCCAAREAPLTDKDQQLWGRAYRRLVRGLVNDGLLVDADGAQAPSQRALKPRDVSLRSMAGRAYGLICEGRQLGEIDPRQLPREAHPGAIYLHDGDSYRVTGVDHENLTVFLRRSDEDVITEPRGERFTDLLDERQTKEILGGRLLASLGRVKATTWIKGYVELSETTGRRLGEVVAIDRPERASLDTVGIRLQARAGVDAASLHALEHLTRALSPLVVLCDRADLDGNTEVASSPSAFIYDCHAGGVGLSERLFESLPAVLAAASDRVRGCQCRDGCPSCIHDPGCFLFNDHLSKTGVLTLLSAQAG